MSLLSLNGWSRETTTWVTHAVATAFVPYIASVFLPFKLIAAAVVASAIAAYFVFKKEPDDRAEHLGIGDYDTPNAQGVTPRIDRWGDTIGPVAVAVTYWLSVLLTYM